MFEEEPEGVQENIQENNPQEEFQVRDWGNDNLNPLNWKHEPKRVTRKGNKQSKSAPLKVNHQEKRKQKIEDKIFTKVVKETDEAPAARPGATQTVKVDREVEAICNILRYMLGEFEIDSVPEYINEERTCEKWEVDEILKQVSDTNLGDFIIKCPNPDNLPPEWIDKYQVTEENGELKSPHLQTKIGQAMQFFYDLFDMETNSRLESERENIAFMIGFYFLKYKSTFDDTTSDEAADSFLKVFDFYKMVEGESLKKYMQMRQEEGFFVKHEYIIAEMFPDQYNLLTCFNEKVTLVDEHEDLWNNLKKMIYLNLNTELLQTFGDEKEEEKEECKYIFGRVKSISELLRTFPDLIEVVLKKVRYFDENKEDLEKQEEERIEKEQEEKEKEKENLENGRGTEIRIEEKAKEGPRDIGKRFLFWGQYLKKTIVGENIIWVNSKGRPNDVATLLRFSLMYKLIVKSKLFLRTFLSRDECHLMLVIKTSQEILENYAQKYKLNMEVDLGASDIFSFEPVDEYMRPLRLHKYVTDQEFLDKYHIKPGTGDGDKKEELQSVESEALNIYKKAQEMNEDELRTLVMSDQVEANALMKYIKSRLQIDYIEQHPIENDYNKDSTDRQTWELYYIYNKLIISFIKRIKALYSVSRKETSYYAQLEGNVGMLLRLMFLKALNMCNQMYYQHREMRSIVPRVLSNMWDTKDKENKLKNIWFYLDIASPSGFCQYYKIDKLERLWRKFEINELKERSKFFPSERLIITNRVILELVNLSSSLDKKHIIDYYPLHDPFTLKSIEVSPYLSVIKNLRKAPKREAESLDASTVNRLYSQYECKLTVSDFTKLSVQKQLQFKFTEFKTFETSSIRSYCGQKISFYFTLIKFLALRAWPLVLPAFIIQILLWIENSDIVAVGTSSLTGFNNLLIGVWIFVNLFWTTDLIESWKQQENTLAQEYGVSQIMDNQLRRVKFEGAFKRDFETDELNFEYVPAWETFLKTFFTVVLNLTYVALVAEVLLMVFLFKTYLYQSGYNQTVVQTAPSIVIAVATQIFTKVYTIIIKNITNFENHKTVTEYQNSLVSKSALISFVINFYSIFIYAFFSGYLSSSFICQVRTSQTNVKIDHCDSFLSSLLLSMIMVDFATTIVGAITPYLVFKGKEWWESRKITKTSKFNYSFFQSIDNFYQEQDRMDSYMYTEELDSSWLGYMNIVNVFAATALFAPALPFSYTMMFLTGIVRLHASKYDVIYLKKRILPTKTNSINWWLTILEILSFISIITNVAYMIFTRDIFQGNQSKMFLWFVIIMFALKYFMLAQYTSGTDIMAKRNEIKTTDIIKNRRRDQFENISEELNTDIENVIYDENKLNRKFHQITKANIKDKAD